MRTKGRRPLRRTAPLATTVSFAIGAAMLISLVAGCTGGPRGLPEGEEPRVASGTEVLLEDEDPPAVDIDPRGLRDRPIDAILLRAYDRDGMVAGEWRLPGTLPFSLPVDGLEDGGTYRFEVTLLSEGIEYPVEDPITVRISIGLPNLRPRVERLVTIDPRPTLSWEQADQTVSGAPYEAARLSVGSEGESRVRVTSAGEGEYLPEEPLVDARTIRTGASVPWTVRAVHRTGVLGPASVPALIVYDLAEAAPVGVTGIDGATMVERPVLRWTETHGAERYRLEVRAGDATDVIELVLEEPRVFLDIESVEAALLGSERRIIRWRVAAEGIDEVATDWSRTYTVRYRTLMPAFFPILPPGMTASLRMGIPAEVNDRVVTGSEQDERPTIDVSLRRPFAMARFELSNQIVSELLTTALNRGLVMEEAGVIRNVVDRRVLAGLDDLEFGIQFGLEAVRDEQGELRAVRPRRGYESHPAVGVSWFGAVYLANALSFLEGRDPVYAISAEGVSAYPDRNGYRLPSEAEWALAAARTTTLDQSIPRIQAEENRPLNALERGAANYLRSGDRWEDVTPPHTAAGGPTVPVGGFGSSNAAGIHDLIGNVWEWCWDWYDPDWYDRGVSRPDTAGPAEPVPDRYGRSLRVVRGNAWNTSLEDLRISNRGAFDPETGSHSIGVRLVYTLR